MADDKGRPIHEASPVSPIGGVAANVPPAGVDPHAPKCVACGRYHGSTNKGTLCLEGEIRRLRAALVLPEPKNILEATAKLLILARFFGQTSKVLSDPYARDAAEQAAVEVAHAALALETRFHFGIQARAIAGLSHPIDPSKGESDEGSK